MKKFNLQDFHTSYPSDDACLLEVFTNRYQEVKSCPSCKKAFKFHRVKGRKCFACQWCGYQLHPLGGTIFHKSSIPLTTWFLIIYEFSICKNGLSAMLIHRKYGMSYNCAWRMAKQIRKLLSQEDIKLSNIVEVDETYIGGRARIHEGGRSLKKKVPVVGMVERGGRVRAETTFTSKARDVIPLLKAHIAEGSHIITDDYRIYNFINTDVYKHSKINHSKYHYVKGNIHTNTIEGFWSQLKRSISGTYHYVSRQHLQSYVDEFVYRYNHRFGSPFPELVLKACLPL